MCTVLVWYDVHQRSGLVRCVPSLIGVDWTGMSVHHILDWSSRDWTGIGVDYPGLVLYGLDSYSLHRPVLV